MPHDHRQQNPGPSDYRRGGRMRSGSDRDRYASGNERRYSADWDEHPADSGGFEGDRSYSAGGYAEEFGHRRPGSRDLERGQGQRGGDYGSPGRWERERWISRRPSEGEPWQVRAAENERRERRGGYEQGSDYPRQADDADRADFRGSRRRSGAPSLLGWDDDPNDLGDYYGTGNYYGAYGTQPSARAEGMRAYGGGYFNDTRSPWNTPRDDWNERGSVSGNYENYGRSRYGAQSGYGRDYGEASGSQRGYGQDYRESYAEQRYGRHQPSTQLGGDWDYEGSGHESSQGEYRGRGPKGYARSDERLKEMVCERLTDDPRIDASDVSIEVEDKVVKLSGTVQDRRTKYLIEDVVEGCGAVKEIENSIRVRSVWHTSRQEVEQQREELPSAQRSATGKNPSSSKRSQS